MMGMSLGRKQDIVPVLTYHSVGMNNDGWVWKHLSEPAGVFARLRQGGCRWRKNPR